jgi:hypothetical protein
MVNSEWSFLDKWSGQSSFIEQSPRTYNLYQPKDNEEKELIERTRRVLLGEEILDDADCINWNSDLTMSEMWFNEEKRLLFKRDNEVVKLVFKY